MASYTGGGSNGPDYVQPGEPANPDPLETWYDTDADPDGDGTAQGQYLIFGTDGAWHSTSVESHRALRDVLEDSHHTYPVPTTGLAADSVTTAKVAADAVTNALIAADAVDTTQLAADAVTTSEVAADAVTTALIANGAVDTAQLAASAVTSSELATDAVTTDAVAADAVTATEVADNESLPVDISGNAATADVADAANDADKLDGVQPGNLQVAYADDAGTVDGKEASELATPSATGEDRLTESSVIYDTTGDAANLFDGDTANTWAVIGSNDRVDIEVATSEVDVHFRFSDEPYRVNDLSGNQLASGTSTGGWVTLTFGRGTTGISITGDGGSVTINEVAAPNKSGHTHPI